jgi:uncharacterized damage-inducible protein DinB
MALAEGTLTMEQVKWFDRTFDFSSKQNIFPSVIERLAGTPVRLEHKVSSLPAKLLSVRMDGTWTIKENIGHLTDLEELWQGRLEDILNNQTTLRPTDLQNTGTTQANHDATPLEELLSDFRIIRQQTLNMVKQLNEEQIFKSALHPRLKTLMRTMDLFLFVAEHDDHHLARITKLSSHFRILSTR